METMTAFEILVIILSVFLAIFLILAIALTIVLLKISRKLNDLVDRTNEFAENIENNLVSFFRKSVTPSVIASGLYQFVRKAKKKSKDN